MNQPSRARSSVTGAAVRRDLGRSARRLGRDLATVAPLPLLAAAAALGIAQPISGDLSADALVGVAGILATMLTIGFAVTLLVAQHTAERHARVLYVEFRRESAWLAVLALLALGVGLIIAGALLAPTVSTGWAALALTAALALYAASLVPRLLDSLDASLLADRVTDRTIEELMAIAQRERPYPDSAMKPIATRGLEIARLIAVQGVGSNDGEVLRAGLRGIRRVLVTFIEGSNTRGWDGEIATLGFACFRDIAERCVDGDAVLMLPIAIEELTSFGVESQRTLEEDGNENTSIRLTSLLLEVVARTLKNDQSAAPAMGTSGIGASALALIKARSPNMVSEHIRKLRTIALVSMAAERDHVAGVAHVELVKIAVGLARMEMDDLMPPSIFEEVCAAFTDSVNAFVERASSSGGLANDWAWNYVTMPHMETNLARVVVEAVAADARHDGHYRRDFGHSAARVVRALVKLGSEGTGGFSTPSDAIEAAYMGVLGAIAVQGGSPEENLVPGMWRSVVQRLNDATKEKGHEVEMLASLLLVGTYEAESGRPHSAAMKEALSEALRTTSGIEDDWHRRRRAQAWIGAGGAALASGDKSFAEAIAKTIAPDVRDLRNASATAGWRIREMLHDDPFSPGGSMPKPEIPTSHTQADVVAGFDALLDKYKRRRRRRPPVAESAPAS